MAQSHPVVIGGRPYVRTSWGWFAPELIWPLAGGQVVDTAAARLRLTAGQTSVDQAALVDTAAVRLHLRPGVTTIDTGGSFIAASAARLRLRPATTSITQPAVDTLAARLRIVAGTTSVQAGPVVVLDEPECEILAPTATCTTLAPACGLEFLE